MDPALAARIGQEVADKMFQYRRDASGWKICREANGVSVSWRPSVEFAGNLYRGEGVVCGTLEDVWDCVRPAEGGLRVKWDENVTGFEVIEKITDTLYVSRTSTPSAAMKLISPRDFVDVVLIKTYEDGTISSNAPLPCLQPPTWTTLHVPRRQASCEDSTIHVAASANQCQGSL